MSRANDTLLKLQNEIQKDPRERGYSGKSPSEIAILMNQDVSQNPKVFIQVIPVEKDVITQKLVTAKSPSNEDVDLVAFYAKIRDVKTLLVNKELASSADFDPKQVEVLTKRSDELSLGEISQGDIEQALLAK